MKYVKVSGIAQEVYVFDEGDNLCTTCSYPLSEGNNMCLSCNIFNCEKNRQFTGGVLYFEKNISVSHYVQRKSALKPEMRSPHLMTWLILNMKSKNPFVESVADILGSKITQFLSQNNLSKNEVLLCSVPDDLDDKYNKSENLLSAVNQKTGISSYDLLNKIKKTEKQHNFKGQGALQKKFENVKDAYVLNNDYSELVAGKIVILIDDVVSSMASINECSKIFRGSGVSKVYIFSLGRNILPELERKK